MLLDELIEAGQRLVAEDPRVWAFAVGGQPQTPNARITPLPRHPHGS